MAVILPVMQLSVILLSGAMAWLSCVFSCSARGRSSFAGSARIQALSWELHQDPGQMLQWLLFCLLLSRSDAHRASRGAWKTPFELYPAARGTLWAAFRRDGLAVCFWVTYCASLMIINDGNVVCTIIFPSKNYSPLLIDSYTPKIFIVAEQPLQSVPGRHFEKVNCWCSIKLIQQSPCFFM